MKKSRNTNFYLAAFVSLVTLLFYFTVLRNGFVEWDDNDYIFDNMHIRSLGITLFRWAFFDFYSANWHPLTWISHALDYAVWGLNPLGHHLTNIVLHAINTYIVIILVVKLIIIWKENVIKNGESTSLDERGVMIMGGVTGLLFGLHPLHVESVAWVSERKDLLCAFFFLLSITTYANQARKENPEVISEVFLNKQYLLSLFFFVLALLSKPMAVSLPFVLLILDWHPFQKICSLKTLRESFVSKIPYFVLSLFSSIVTIFAQQSAGAIKATPLLTRLLVAGKAIVAYLGKMIIPLNLVPYYPYPREVSFLSSEYFISVVIIAGITVACILSASKQRLWLSAWCYYVVTLLPVAGIVKIGDQAMADRYTYLSSLAPFLLIGLAAVWADRTVKQWSSMARVFSTVTAIFAVVFMLYLTHKQIGVWENSYTLWNYVNEKEPGKVPLAYINLAAAYGKEGLFNEAKENLDKALALNPDSYIAFKNRGMAYEKMGQLDKAIDDYSRAIALDSSSQEAYIKRGIVYKEAGRFNRAIEDYDQAISLNPNNCDAYFNRGVAEEKLGQLNKAIDDYSKAIGTNPTYYEAYNNIGILYGKAGSFDRAIEYLTEAVLLNKSNPRAYLNRGIMYWRMGSKNFASADLQKACNMGGADACRALQALLMTSSGK
jgi:protein O-mannosyl-transferase